jgi:predicted acetyltransferase
MMVEVRPVPKADQRRWYEAVMVAFGEDLEEGAWLLDEANIPPDRVLGGYDGDLIVGGGAAFSFEMTVPGDRSVPVAGVTMVGVMPTHRRQGVLRSLMGLQLADVRARGEPMAALWASEGNIYQRFGYGLATLSGTIDIERARADFRRPVIATGHVELRDTDAARPAVLRIYDTVRPRTPGFYVRDASWWDMVFSDAPFRRRGASKRFNAILVRDGQEVGYVLYRVKSEWLETGPANTLIVVELMGIDADAIAQLWRYVFGVDLMSRIRWRHGPVDNPLLLMVAEPRRLQLRVGDALWVRIVDVPRALEGRGYAADGSIVLEVTDEFMPDVGGRWRLNIKDSNARAESTTDPADLQLEIQDLGAVYMGGFTFASLGRAGRTVECTPAARDRADALFATTVVPWCPEVF